MKRNQEYLQKIPSKKNKAYLAPLKDLFMSTNHRMQKQIENHNNPSNAIKIAVRDVTSFDIVPLKHHRYYIVCHHASDMLLPGTVRYRDGCIYGDTMTILISDSGSESESSSYDEDQESGKDNIQCICYDCGTREIKTVDSYYPSDKEVWMSIGEMYPIIGSFSYKRLECCYVYEEIDDNIGEYQYNVRYGPITRMSTKDMEYRTETLHVSGNLKLVGIIHSKIYLSNTWDFSNMMEHQSVLDGDTLPCLYSCTLDGGKWEHIVMPLIDELSDIRYAGFAFAGNNKIYVCCGSTKNRKIAQWYCYTPQNDRWERVMLTIKGMFEAGAFYEDSHNRVFCVCNVMKTGMPCLEVVVQDPMSGCRWSRIIMDHCQTFHADLLDNIESIVVYGKVMHIAFSSEEHFSLLISTLGELDFMDVSRIGFKDVCFHFS